MDAVVPRKKFKIPEKSSDSTNNVSRNLHWVLRRHAAELKEHEASWRDLSVYSRSMDNMPRPDVLYPIIITAWLCVLPLWFIMNIIPIILHMRILLRPYIDTAVVRPIRADATGGRIAIGRSEHSCRNTRCQIVRFSEFHQSVIQISRHAVPLNEQTRCCWLSHWVSSYRATCCIEVAV